MIWRLALTAAALAIATPAQAAFDPIEFFRGRTHGEGLLKIIFQAPKRVAVDSRGYADKDGTLVVEQVIREGAKPARTRYWRLRQTAPGRFAGTLSDAASAVRIEQIGDTLRIRYKARDHLDIDQRLTPAGPHTLLNKLRVKRFGITVAHLDETIRKVD